MQLLFDIVAVIIGYWLGGLAFGWLTEASVSVNAVVIDEVLLETDVPDLVTARDEYGMQYLCCFTSRDSEGDKFLVVPISVAKLGKLKSGTVDLRSIMLAPETGMHYSGVYLRVDGKPTIHLSKLDGLPVEDDLPSEGLFLSDFYD